LEIDVAKHLDCRVLSCRETSGYEFVSNLFTPSVVWFSSEIQFSVTGIRWNWITISKRHCDISRNSSSSGKTLDLSLVLPGARCRRENTGVVISP